MAVALVTGGSRGLGRDLALGLAERGWSIVIDGRRESALRRAGEDMRSRLRPGCALAAVVGDVTDAAHRRVLIDAAGRLGGLDLLVNNASILGPSPLPHLVDFPLDRLRAVFEANTFAPVGLISDAIGLLRASPDPRIINVTSDAAVEAYEGWGGYGSAKAALDHLSAVFAEEEPEIRVWSVDPGDMRTQMHQDAFPGEDISDRPEPGEIVPAFLALIDSAQPSGRLRAADLLSVEATR